MPFLQQRIGEICNVDDNIQLSSQAAQLVHVFQFQRLPMLMLFQFLFVKTVHELCQSHYLTGCIFPVYLPCPVLLKQDGGSPVISLPSVFFKINDREWELRPQEESTWGGRVLLISENSFCKVNLHSLIGKSRSEYLHVRRWLCTTTGK